jgi:glycerol transport system ATP-binding protein
VRLELDNISKKVGAEQHLYTLSLALVPGTINVLLGATAAGKTSLLRVIAGLDRPSSGRVLADGRDVTGISVRQRNLAMVYQQFINYPTLSVFENIASPLRIAGVPAAQIRARVTEMAERLHIAPWLQRTPTELSGGQQQRTALARALIKNAELLLLDEPLVNLDYKLREELRHELSDLFADGKTTVVYATTEPLEALQLGGHTIVLHEGRLLQQGPTLQVFNAPASIQAARSFSDPPINLLAATLDKQHVAQLGAGIELVLNARQQELSAGRTDIVLGLRAHSLRLKPHDAGDFAIEVGVDLGELSGYETYVHSHREQIRLVAQLPGVHQVALGQRRTLYFRPDDLFVFAPDGALLCAPPAPAQLEVR